ncbi:hypothetical protein SAMN02799631_04359 [Methylobacterium sp. 174MFSha1.1]|uniref:hypothetical protein n=1 Tax=Methylobacterium sp. 174MFSha1.1 TaxID=1502749 RepID=UPI0008E6D7F9|nr:hypothetical protein [Methylobacterium sp. 174MFSha1.1]SFV06130.1 hypothetical protein SAMN02799631_04359 [Methylobacterium sp. 174MFSha1.1]
MPELKTQLRADPSLYDAADAALRALRQDLVRRAQAAFDYEMVVDFGDCLLRYAGSTIAKASSTPNAAEHVYRVADDLVAASVQGGEQ